MKHTSLKLHVLQRKLKKKEIHIRIYHAKHEHEMTGPLGPSPIPPYPVGLMLSHPIQQFNIPPLAPVPRPSMT